MRTQIKTPAEIKAMRQSGRILATTLAELTQMVAPGITTRLLDDKARQITAQMGAKPAFLGYNDFPAAICISVNDEIVHGIPSDRVLAEGDIVGLDFGVTYEGMISDSAVTLPVGQISKPAQHLLTGVKKALDMAINGLHDGIRVGDIGDIIESSLEGSNLSVIYSLGGHGVGHRVHEEPFIANFGSAGTGETLRAGMTIALEPIASLGSHDCVLASDGQTYITRDGSLSAQFEHTLLITPTGAEIMTQL